MLIKSVIGPVLHESAIPDPRWRIRHGVSTVIQVSPTQVVLLANRRVTEMRIVDFEDGADAVVFNAVDGIKAQNAVPLVRTEKAVHPRTREEMQMVAYLITGGFVPFGAVLPDGTPHPAAGTGFALASYGCKHHANELSEATIEDPIRFHELLQLRFDGNRLEVTERLRFTPDVILPECHCLVRPITNALPDGEDLVSGLVAGPAEKTANGDPMIPSEHPHAHPVFGRNFGCGFCRWKFGENGWRPKEYTPVTGGDLSFEPSMIRELDGSLLMAVRGKGLKEPPGAVHDGLENTYEHFRVYRSTDNGKTWESVLHLPRMRNATPVILNQAVDGTPFIGANPYYDAKDSKGRVVPSTKRRDPLCIWPLTADRTNVEEPLCLMHAAETIGSPRPIETPTMGLDNLWMIDHPIGNVCRLADGKWHSLVCFRISDNAVNSGNAAAADAAGIWLAEIGSEGEEQVEVWKFA